MLIPQDARRDRVPRRILPERVARRVPGVGWLAALVARVAAVHVGRTPVGLLALLPVALLLDFFDVADELVGGPVGMLLSFVLETGFVLGLTGRVGYAVGFAGIDLLPFVDVVPFATLTLLHELSVAWGEREPEGRVRPDGPVIDV